MNTTRSVVLVASLSHSRRLLLLTVLQNNGYETLQARDGFEALHSAVGHKVDMLIAEEEMPGLSGRELIGLVRKHRVVTHCVLISDSDRRPNCTSANCKDNFQTVPFEPELLLVRVNQAFHPAL